jgi:glycosyltransferase involved in cell wall biosynthesis
VRLLYLADIRFPIERANGIQTIETCHALAARGHLVSLLVRPDTARPARDPWAFYDLAPDSRLTIRRAPVTGSVPLRRLLYLAQALGVVLRSAPRIDAVVTRDLGVAALLVRLPRAVRAPLVYESHGLAAVFAETLPDLLGVRAGSKAKIRRLVMRDERVWRLAEGYVTITAGLLQDLRDRFGERSDAAVIPDGVRMQTGRPFVSLRETTEPLVTYAGHLYPWKGVDVLLRALTRLPHVRARIIGGHPAESDLGRLRTLAQELGIERRVELTGLVQRRMVPGLLDQADALVLPHTSTPVSERYASPLKLFEYMAAGKPIVASDLSAIREILRDGQNACLVRAGDEAALAAGLSRVLTDTSFAESIARTAYDEAASYTWDRRAERLEHLLEHVRKTG